VYDPVTQILHLTGEKHWQDGKEEQRKITRTALRYTFPQELAALLHYTGFRIERQYGDWNYEPLSASSPSIISICRKRVDSYKGVGRQEMTFLSLRGISVGPPTSSGNY
jgi:hypothetical protein